MKTVFYWLAAFVLVFLLSSCSTALYNAAIDIERWRAGVNEKSLDADGLQLSYLVGGSGENILMLHGFGANKDSWNRFARHLTDGYRVIAVDLPGHGDSTSSLADTYKIQSQARRVALFVDELGLDRFHLFGSSMGGAIALYYTHLHSNRVVTLGLMGSAGVLSPNPSEYVRMLEKGDNPLLFHSKDDFDIMLKLVMVEPPYMPWFIKNAVYEQYMQRQAINQKIFNDIQTEEIGNAAFLQDIG